MQWLLLFILIIIVAVLIALAYRAYTAIPAQAVSSYNNGNSARDIPIWFANIEKETLKNPNWREVLTTSHNLQVVAMNTPPGESLGWEVHQDNDQFFRVESGECELSVSQLCDSTGRADGNKVQKIKLTDGMSALVPKGLCHNVMNTGKEPLRMYTIYGPPHHPPGTIDRTHADEIARETTQ